MILEQKSSFVCQLQKPGQFAQEVKRNIQQTVIQSEILHGGADRNLRFVLAAVKFQRLCIDAQTGFDLHRNDPVAVLNEEVNFRLAPAVKPVADRLHAEGVKLFKDEIFGKPPFEIGENVLTVCRDFRRNMCQFPQDTKRGKKTCPVGKIGAATIEDTVREQAQKIFQSPYFLEKISARTGLTVPEVRSCFNEEFWSETNGTELNRLYSELFDKIIMKENQIVIEIKTAGIQALTEEVLNEHQ